MPADEFLRVAVQEGLLSEDGAQRVEDALTSGDATASQLCLQMGEMTASQIDAVDGLLNPSSVADGYVVEGLLGRGGSGIVYRARQSGLDRIVALKTISMAQIQAPLRTKAVARFRQESKVVAKLQHPNIVTAFDAGATDDRVYLAMELVPGEDLDDYVLRRGRLDETTAWQIALQVASALSHAKQLGVVHRDIKPGNLLITQPVEGYQLPPGVPLVKVTDFGLARLADTGEDARDTRITMEGITLGTPHYMAPEQVDSAANVDFEADIYALGATVFHMLAGKPPWAKLKALNVFGKKMSQMPAPMDELPDDVSVGGKVLLARMLEPQPEERHANYAELQAAIRCLIAELESGDTLTDDSAYAVGDEYIHERETVNDSPPKQPPLKRPVRPTRRTLAAIGLALAALAGAIAIGFFALNRTSPVRRYVESQQLDAVRPLYRGTSITGWQGVAKASLEGDEAGMLQVLGIARVSINEARKSLPDPNHFGISVRVQVKEGSAIEIWYDVQFDGAIEVVRISDQQMTLGQRASERDAFVPHGAPKRLESSTLAPNPVIRIDRDATHWFIGQAVPGEPPPPRTLGWTRFRANEIPAAMVRFKAEGDNVFIGDVELVELRPITR